MATYEVVLDSSPTDADLRAVKQGLDEFNNQHTEPENRQPLGTFVRDPAGEVIGGLLAFTHWRWLYVDVLWISESLRGQGFSRQLMQRAEAEARARGCWHAFLDTTSYQALGFYQKLGYEIFGQLDDYPPGHVSYFLQKRRL